MTKQQMKKDFEYMEDTYGGCEDCCGDICNTEMFINLIRGRVTKEQCMIDIMQRYYDTGTCSNEEVPESDEKAQKIFQRWIESGLIEDRKTDKFR